MSAPVVRRRVGGSPSLRKSGGGPAMKSLSCPVAEEQQRTRAPRELYGDTYSLKTRALALKIPSDTCGVTGETMVPPRQVRGAPHTTASYRQPRAVPRPVSLKGRMTANGYEPENCDWLDLLTEIKSGRRIGRNPLTIEPDVLRAAFCSP
jgi:hypothetical protein